MESIMPLLFVIYIVATIASAVMKKMNTPPQPPRPLRLPPSEEGGGGRTVTPPERPQGYDIPAPSPIAEPEPVVEYRVEEMWPADDAPHGSDSSTRMVSEPAPAVERPVEERVRDLISLREIGARRPRPSGPPVRAQGSDARQLITPESLPQAILLAEILGPPRALRPYRPPVINGGGR